MLRTKGNEEFDKWWKQWSSMRARNRVGVSPPFGKMPGTDSRDTADAGPGRVGTEQVAGSPRIEIAR
jgi:hypothetical protein